MPKVAISPKFTYSNGSSAFYVYYDKTSNESRMETFLNGMLMSTFDPSQPNMLFPTWKLPVLGNSHDERVHDRITVTSLYLKITFRMDSKFLRTPDLFTFLPSSVQWPANPMQFIKTRLMIVEFDDDVAASLNADGIRKWFFRTFCWYRNPSQTPTLDDKVDNNAQQVIPPISVWSSTMHTTTPWIGKFNILADKKIELKPTRTQYQLSFKLPLNRIFTFLENSNDLIKPNIYCFLFGPLSYEQDLDSYNSERLVIQSDTVGTSLIGRVEWFAKLNFVDL